MLKHIQVETRLFGNEAIRPQSQQGLLAFLEALTLWNEIWLREHPEAPLLYSAKLRYILPEQFERTHMPQVGTVRAYLESRKAPVSVLDAFDELAAMTGAGEHFRDIPSMIENGGGDCDNWATGRAAEIRVRLGVDARPFITWRRRPDGGMTYHNIVFWPDGSSEDPSLLIGMGGESKARERAIERAKNEYRRWQYRHGTRERAVAGVLKELPADMRDEGLSWFEDDDRVAGQDWGFGQGVQYLPTFWSDDAFEDWRPGAPQAFWQDPRIPGGNIPTSGPLTLASTSLWRADRFDDEYGDDDDFLDGIAEAVANALPEAIAMRLAQSDDLTLNIDDPWTLTNPGRVSQAAWRSPRVGKDRW